VTGAAVHTLFDLLAGGLAAAMTFTVYRWRLQPAAARVENAGPGYAVALLCGAAAGGYGLGTLNLRLGGEVAVARSFIGALAGAIVAIEAFKRLRGITGSTGLVFVPALAVSVLVGRIGCFLSGIDDHTHGTPSTLPWSHDFGDGVLRHPVQLYESAAMAAFLAYALAMLARRDPWFMQNGFYAFVFWYTGTRFVWEFLKPYAPIAGPFNLFHAVALALAVYALAMMRGVHERSAA
jgi:phosphatidylglycerol---prolipoprotein diacylglyceryl transferase